MKRSQSYHDVLRLEVSVHKTVFMKLLEASSNHKKDLVEVARVSVVGEIFSEVHLITRKREGKVMRPKVRINERAHVL